MLDLLSAALARGLPLPREVRLELGGLAGRLVPDARVPLTGEAAGRRPDREIQMPAARIVAAAGDVAQIADQGSPAAIRDTVNALRPR